MGSRRNQQFITHRFGGGWATDYGPNYYGAPDRDGILTIPFLVDAKNCFFEFDGGPHKCGGTSAVNSTTLGSASGVNGLYDFWRTGTAGSPAQKIVAHVDSRIVSTDTSGNTTVLKSGLTQNAVPHYSTFQDLLLIGSDSMVDVPQSWDQTTFQNLAGSPPRFSFSVPHRNRQFAAGDWAQPSRLYYSVSLAPDDWAGAGSGSIDIAPDDGDMITGIISHMGNLIIFKGPYKGSIHILTGSSSSDFVVAPFISGIGAAWQNSIFRFGDDLGFLSQYGSVHSFNTTNAFGNFTQAYLSYPIGSYVRDDVNHVYLRKAWAVNNPLRNYVLISLASSVSSTNNTILMMDYRWLSRQMMGALSISGGEQYPRWALWTAFNFSSIALVTDTNNDAVVWGGGYDGTLYRTDQSSRSHQSAAIPHTVTTPFLSYGSEYTYKTLERGSLGLRPKNNNSVTVSWQRDSQARQTHTITQGSTNTWGGGGTWGNGSLWGGPRFTPRFFDLEEGGEFRDIQYQVTDAILNSDLELHSFGAGITFGSSSTEN